MSESTEVMKIDPRIQAAFAMSEKEPEPRFSNREELLAWANSDEAVATRQASIEFLESQDSEEIAPSDGLSIQTRKVVSDPDGNTINIQLIRPETAEPLPCVYYIHGGGMMDMSCYYGNYKAWGKILAKQGVAVAMVDFRNSLVPSSVPAADGNVSRHRALPRCLPGNISRNRSQYSRLLQRNNAPWTRPEGLMLCQVCRMRYGWEL